MMQGNTKSTLRSDYAIMTRINHENKMLNAEHYDKKMKYLGVNAKWYENQERSQVFQTKKNNNNRIMRELMLTNQEIKIRRKVKLTQLYHHELRMYEDELEQKGLAVVKER